MPKNRNVDRPWEARVGGDHDPSATVPDLVRFLCCTRHQDESGTLYKKAPTEDHTFLEDPLESFAVERVNERNGIFLHVPSPSPTIKFGTVGKLH